MVSMASFHDGASLRYWRPSPPTNLLPSLNTSDTTTTTKDFFNGESSGSSRDISFAHPFLHSISCSVATQQVHVAAAFDPHIRSTRVLIRQPSQFSHQQKSTRYHASSHVISGLLDTAVVAKKQMHTYPSIAKRVHDQIEFHDDPACID